MATHYHAFGACVPAVSTGTPNTNTYYETLGVSQNGGRIEIEYLEKPIFSDLSGPMTPAEYQQMGVKARIMVEVIAPDEAIVAKIRKRSAANPAGSEGTPGTPGTLMGTTANCSFSLYLPSSVENPWVFTTCKLAQDGIKEGTESEPYRFTFDAWRFIPGTAATVANTTLYTRTAPS